MLHLQTLGCADGPPLVMWHGVMRSSRTFAPLVGALASRWRLHLPDHRGHGLSLRADSYLVADHISDAVELVRSLPSPAILYGHSLGALVAAGVAAAVPERVAGAVLEDPPSPSFLANLDSTAYGSIFRGMQALSRRKEASVAQIAADLAALPLPGGMVLGQIRDATSLRLSARLLREMDPEALSAVLANRWLEGIDFPTVLRRVRCPVLLLRADDAAGGMLSAAEAAMMAEALADPVSISFPGIGHQIHWQATEPLLRHLLAFLESLP